MQTLYESVSKNLTHKFYTQPCVYKCAFLTELYLFFRLFRFNEVNR